MFALRSTILFFFFCAVAFEAFAQVSPLRPLRAEDLVGRWVERGTSDEGNAIEFFADGRAFLRFVDSKGKADESAGLPFQFRLDASKKPAWLDLMFVAPDGREHVVFMLIIEAVGENKIRVCGADDSSIRATRFDEAGTTSTGTLYKE